VVYSPDGSFGIQLEGWAQEIWFPLPGEDDQTRLSFEVDELPFAVVVKAVDGPTAMWLVDPSQQMECWLEWSDFVPPVEPADFEGDYYENPDAGLVVACFGPLGY